MKNNNKLRIIIWSVLAFISLGLGFTGLILSGDIKDINFNWFNWFNNGNENTVKVDFNKVVDDLNNYLDELYADTEGYSGVATYANDKISVHIQASEQEYNIEFLISENIISNESSKDLDGLANALLFSEILYSVEKEYGVSKEEVNLTLTSDEIENLTLEKDGIEVKEYDDKITYKLDYTRKMTVLNVENYITIENFNDDIDMVNTMKNGGSYQKNHGDITLYSQTDDQKNIVVSLIEKDNTTNISYNTFISFITVLIDEDEANKFKSLYNSFPLENQNIENYNIEINPAFNDIEKYIVSNSDEYKLVRITINNSLIQ